MCYISSKKKQTDSAKIFHKLCLEGRELKINQCSSSYLGQLQFSFLRLRFHLVDSFDVFLLEVLLSLGELLQLLQHLQHEGLSGLKGKSEIKTFLRSLTYFTLLRLLVLRFLNSLSLVLVLSCSTFLMFLLQ